MIKEWAYSADNIIYHFRCVSQAMFPFSLEWNQPRESLPNVLQNNLDEPAFAYMQQIVRLVRERGMLGSHCWIELMI